MKVYTQIYVRDDTPTEGPDIVLIVTDENPKGVTLTIKDNSPEGPMASFWEY